METNIQKMPVIKLNPNKLYYYKCLDCLTPVAVDVQDSTDIKCDCGGDHLTFMGQVVGKSYVKPVEQCKCNEICAHASGPNCSCACGSVNHGLKMKAYIQVNKVTGKVEQRIRCKQESIAHAEWYRAVLETIQDSTIYGDLKEARDNMQKGIRCDYATCMAIYRINSLKSEFRNAKTVKKRESVLEKIRILSTRETKVQNGVETSTAQNV